MKFFFNSRGPAHKRYQSYYSASNTSKSMHVNEHFFFKSGQSGYFKGLQVLWKEFLFLPSYIKNWYFCQKGSDINFLIRRNNKIFVISLKLLFSKLSSVWSRKNSFQSHFLALEKFFRNLSCRKLPSEKKNITWGNFWPITKNSYNFMSRNNWKNSMFVYHENLFKPNFTPPQESILLISGEKIML